MYIFNPPAKAFDVSFDYVNLTTFIREGKSDRSRKVGTTVTVERVDFQELEVSLYNTVIATLYSDGTVFIHQEIDSQGSQATTWWVQKVLSDNKIPGLVGRDKGRYAQAGQTFTKV